MQSSMCLQTDMDVVEGQKAEGAMPTGFSGYRWGEKGPPGLREAGRNSTLSP